MTYVGGPRADMLEMVGQTLARSDCTSNEEAKAEEIFSLHAESGLRVTFECLRVAIEACAFLGRPYLQVYELSEYTVDCSTLSSQAHWLGAAQQIPFIAENQRTARASLIVTLDEVLPGDVLVKYPDLRATPDGLHNHVALVLGQDRRGEIWVVESSSAGADSLVPAREFDPSGGVRRFCENPLCAFESLAATNALALANRVSKQGRLGALRNPRRPSHRFRLPGIDIPVVEGTPILSPIAGMLSIVESDEGRWVEIADNRGWVCRIGNCEPSRHGRYPMSVGAGQFIGQAKMNMNLPWHETSCLYWEMGSATAVAFGTGKNRIIRSNYEVRQGLKCYNPLYMAKLALVQLPVLCSAP